ncbi:MAG: DUF2092 domain-containing protein [Candidatus Competibacteraceae bacterium]
MIQYKLIGRTLLLAAGLFLAAGVNAQQPPTAPKAAAEPAQPPSKEAAPAIKPVLEPKAIDLLKAMSARLTGAKLMSFTALTTYEHPSRLGPALAYTTLSEVLMERPNKLRVLTAGDGPASEFYYDGKVVMVYSPAENLVAMAEAPPTLDAMLKAAFERAGIYFPFTDVIVADPYKDIAEGGLVHAFYIGQSKIVGGTTTDMVAYADSDVFVQLWIGADDKLPRLMRAVYRADKQRLRHQVEFSQWKLNPPAAAEAFTSAKARAAKRIEFKHPAAPPPGSKPPAAQDKPSEAPPPKSQ